MRRISNYLMTFLMAVALIACGGGGGSPGTTSGSVPVTTTPAALFTTAPSSIILASGATVNYQVSGGVAPYAVASDVVSLVSASISDSTLSITAIKGGAASVFVTDSKGTSVTISVSVSLPGALFTTAPVSLNMSPNSFATYQVTGGAAPYTASSTDDRIATVLVNGSTLLVNTFKAGSVTLSVLDAAGASKSIALTVDLLSSGQLFTPPAAVTIPIGSTTVAYAITGGALPYVALSSNPGVMGVTLGADGKSFTITGVASGTASVGISDAKGALVTVAVTVPPADALFTTAPSSLTMPVPTSANPSLTFSILGGTPNFTVVSFNPNVVSVAPPSAGGTAYTLTSKSGGSTTILISDSKGATLSISVTVPTNLLSLHMPTGTTIGIGAPGSTYKVSGGVPPYTSVSADTSIFTASTPAADGTFVLQGVSEGVAIVRVYDATGSWVFEQVKVSSKLFTDASAFTTLSVGTTNFITVYGGVPFAVPASAYVVNTSNPEVVRVALNGNKLTVTGLTAGSATVAISDSKGAITTLQFSVPTPSSVYSDAPSFVSISSGTANTYTVFGGVPLTTSTATAPKYNINNSDPTVVTASMVGSTLTIGGSSSGSATLVVSDSLGASTTVNVTVTALGALRTSAPSSLTLTGDGLPITFAIAGGDIPYSAMSDNTSLVTAAASGTTLTITAKSGTNGGTANVIVSDVKGKQVTVRVTVPTPVALSTTAPSSLNMPMPAGSNPSLSFAIFGGAPNYTVVSSNPDVVSVVPPAAGGSNYTLTSKTGGTADILISDAKGATVRVFATVPSAPTLFTDAQVNLTVSSMAPGNTYTVTVSGGVKPYSALSSNVVVASATTPAADGKFVIQGLSAGFTNVTIKDATGTEITLAVTVPSPTALFSTAPATLGILSGHTDFFTIFGGTAPYSVNDIGNGVIVRSVLSGSALSITGMAPGNKTVAISDAKGAVIRIDVTVNPGLFVDSPSNVTIVSGTGSIYTVHGGVPYTSGASNYRVNSSNPAVATATVTASTLSISALTNGSTSLVISDAVGATTTIDVTVLSAGALMSTAPSNLTLAVGATSDTYAVTGGTGAYTAVSTNTALATAVVTGGSSTAGSTLVIKAAAGSQGGNVTVNVTDTAGNKFTVSVTVSAPAALSTTAPATLAIAPGGSSPVNFGIFGGTGAGTYRAVSSNVAVAIVSDPAAGSTLTILGIASGVTTVTVYDAKGASVTIPVTVTSPGPLFTSAPSGGVTIPKNLEDTFNINGGSPTYKVTTSNQAVATISRPDALSFKITAVAAGSAVITVTDLSNNVVNIPVTVPQPGVLYTAAPVTVNIDQIPSNLFSYPIYGGYPPYTVRGGDNSVVQATLGASNTLDIKGVGGGTTDVVVKDSQGQVVTVQVSVGSSTKLFSNAPGSAPGSPVTLALNATQPYTYVISGGSQLIAAGAYSVRSNDSSVVDGTFAGTVLTVTPIKIGSATLRITDAVGVTLDISFTVVSGTGSVGGSSAVAYPTILPTLKTTVAPIASTNSIDAINYTDLIVTLLDPNGAPITVPQVITASGDATKISFPQGNAALTDPITGKATIKVARASLLASGAGAITLTFDYKSSTNLNYSSGGSSQPSIDRTVTSYIGYQVTTANISLTGLTIGANPLPAYGTSQVEVTANINNANAGGTPVTVSFSTTCGQIPATATTDNTGKAYVTYSATDAVGTSPSTLGCGGKTVQITASTSGASAVNLTPALAVTAAPATSISFVSALPQRIYLANSGGVTVSTLTFQLLNQQGEPLAGKSVNLSLRSPTSATPNASFSASSTQTVQTLTTDSNGKVNLQVYSGSVPTNVIVNAALSTTPAVNTDSSVLTIASGRPVQSRISIAFEKLALEGANLDGTLGGVTAYLADRQGNPVPDGTAVNFVTEGGVMVPATCTTGDVANGGSLGDSKCSVKVRTGNPRPAAPGLVTVLAYARGEEDFVDANGDNVYSCGEAFTDLGNVYRDDRMTAAVLNGYDSAIGEFTVPFAAQAGTLGCANRTIDVLRGVPGTQDGVWGATNVRAQAPIVFSTSAAAFSNVVASLGGIDFRIADINGLSMATGSTVTVTVAPQSAFSTCKVVAGGSASIPNQLTPFNWAATFGGCLSGDIATVEIKSATSGTVTSRSYPLP